MQKKKTNRHTKSAKSAVLRYKTQVLPILRKMLRGVCPHVPHILKLLKLGPTLCLLEKDKLAKGVHINHTPWVLSFWIQYLFLIAQKMRLDALIALCKVPSLKKIKKKHPKWLDDGFLVTK